jgi:hypothetical protein
MARIITVDHLWPLFVTVMPEEIGLEDVRSYIAEVNALYDRKARFATLVDSSRMASVPGAAERRKLAEWQNTTVALIRRYNVFTATVVRSAVMRGALTAMHWVFPPPNEQIAVASFGEGFAIALNRLEADGCVFPDALRRLAPRGGSLTLEEVLGEPPAATTRRAGRG